jgi:hypothetical protein
MLMSVQAKVRCTGNSRPPYYGDDQPDVMRSVRFTPVYDSDPEHPNFEWSAATPSGYIELTITNPDAFSKFEVNKEYLLTFEPVPSA